jgi:D-sedoheptulose 7-phosphate isomerase
MKEIIICQIEESIQYLDYIRNNSDIINQIAGIAHLLCQAYNNDHKLLLFGNGGSAADAQHIAAEMINKFRLNRGALPAIALTTDGSVLTAIANDDEYGAIFERQIEALAVTGDVAIGISTSGNSLNVCRGLSKAKEKGALTVGLLGNNGGQALSVCDIAIIIPGNNTPRIQEAHIMIGHIVCDIVERIIFKKDSLVLETGGAL